MPAAGLRNYSGSQQIGSKKLKEKGILFPF